MSFKKLLHALAIAFLSFTFVQTTAACDRAALYLENVVDLGNNQYQIDLTFCTAGGLYASYQNTGTFSFTLSGGSTFTSFPQTLTSPQNRLLVIKAFFTGRILFYIIIANMSGGLIPEVGMVLLPPFAKKLV